MRARHEWLEPTAGLCAGAFSVVALFAVAANSGCASDGPEDLSPARGGLPEVEVAAVTMPASCPAHTLPPDAPRDRTWSTISAPSHYSADSTRFPLHSVGKGMIELTGLWSAQTSYAESDTRGNYLVVADYRAETADGSCLAVTMTVEVGEPHARPLFDETTTVGLEGRLEQAAAESGVHVRGLRLAFHDEDPEKAVWTRDVLRSFDAVEVDTTLAALHATSLTPIDAPEQRSHDCGCSNERLALRNLTDSLESDLWFTAIGTVVCAVSGIATGPGGLAVFLACMAVVIAYLAVSQRNLLRDIEEAADELNCCSHTVASIVRAGVTVSCMDTSNPVQVVDGDGDRVDVTIDVPDPLNPDETMEVECCYYYPGQDNASLKAPPCKGTSCNGKLCGEKVTDADGNQTISQCPMGPCEGQPAVPEGACEQATGELFAEIEGVENPDKIQEIIDGLKTLKNCKVTPGAGAGGGGGAPPAPGAPNIIGQGGDLIEAVACVCAVAL